MMSETTTTGSSSPLRIACLEPSATAICLALGLQDSLVGVTHECHELVEPLLIASPHIRTLTKNGLTVTSQKDIHQAVQDAAAAKASALTSAVCPLPSSSSSSSGLAAALQDSIPSLYPLLAEELAAAQPTVIFTQNLCAVCAPTVKDVQEVLLQQQQQQQQHQQQEGSSLSSSSVSVSKCQVVSLQPHTLEEVAETFVTVARACGVEERGQALKTQWLSQFQQLQEAIHRTNNNNRSDDDTTPPRLLILEWLDPPFDGGHWTYQMMDHAGVINANSIKQKQKQKQKDDDQEEEPKSKQIEWSFIESSACDPDVIVVGCCGFDLARNVQDVHAQARRFQKLRAGKQQRVYACNGNIYIAQPGPSLLQGAVVLAKCAYQDQPKVLEAIDALGFLDKQEEATAWKHVNVMDNIIGDDNDDNDHDHDHDHDDAHSGIVAKKLKTTTTPHEDDIAEPLVIDMEDLMGGECCSSSSTTAQQEGFAAAHERACQQGEKTYLDPVTGYTVFTAVGHKERGWCCGSGCRHCPFSHQNVKDKAARIQQPSILYRMKEESTTTTTTTTTTNTDDDSSTHHQESSLFSIQDNAKIKVLFFSGGKDSFLTIRALVREYYLNAKKKKNEEQGPLFGLILLTTFDATTRNIAHQNVKIEQVIRQAEHLNITLVGIPLRRGSGETYQERIERGLALVREECSPSKIESLVFGDLHLEHIKEWRDKTLDKFSCQLEYPLWKVPYSTLLEDLELSQVPCSISGSTVDSVAVGTTFDRDFYERAISLGLDGFGEKGEFHSLAQVWEVSRATALGLT